MWPSFVKAAHAVMESNRGQPGYDIYGNKIKIRDMRFPSSKMYPDLDADCRINQRRLLMTYAKVELLTSLIGETVVFEVFHNGRYLAKTASGKYCQIYTSLDDNNQKFSSVLSWQEAIALQVIPQQYILRQKIEDLGILVWDYNQDHPEITQLVHALRVIESAPLPVSMQGVAKKYGLIGMW